MCRRVIQFVAVLLVVGGARMSYAQDPSSTQQPNEPQTISDAVPTPSSIGLMPVYGALLSFDKSWVDGKKFPSAQPSFGVSDSWQQLWDNQLKACGFNALQISVDVRDAKAEESTRLANLCVWAKQNGVQLIPILTGADQGLPLPPDFSVKAGSFVRGVLSLLKRNKGAHLEAYSQILCFQIERALNHPASHGAADSVAAVDLITQTAVAIRKQESSALTGGSIRPTQLMVSLSMDCELVKLGAIQAVEMTDEVYGQAYEALKAFASAISASPEVSTVCVEWFPGSISAEAVDRIPELVKALSADVPGKMLVLATGMSTGFRGADEQARFSALTYGNLADYRASEGVDCPFLGILWRTAIDGPNAEAAPPTATTLEEMNQWDWATRSQELVQVWTEPQAGTAEMAWWLKRVESGFGILSVSKDDAGNAIIVPKQSYEMLTELQSTIAQAAVAAGATQTAEQLAKLPAGADTAAGGGQPGAQPPVGTPVDQPNVQPGDAQGGAPASVGQILKDTLQAGLASVVTAVFERVKQNILGGAGTGTGGEFSGGTTGEVPVDGTSDGLADLRLEGAPTVPASLKADQPASFQVVLFNEGAATATNAIAVLASSDGSTVAQSVPTTVPAGGSVTVTIVWEQPVSMSGMKIILFCDNETNPANNEAAIGEMTVGEAADSGAGSQGVLGTPGRVSQLPLDISTQRPGRFILTKVSAIPPGFLKVSPLLPSSSANVTLDAKSGLSFVANKALPFSLPITNPFTRPFGDVRATLIVDGKTVVTRQLGTVLPGQRRTINFMEFTPTRAATYDVRVQMEGKGTNGKTMRAMVGGRINVVDATRTPIRISSLGSRSLIAAVSVASMPRSLSPFAPRTIAAPASIVPAVRPTILPPIGNRMIVTSGRTLAAAYGPASPRISPNGVRLDRFPPTIGQPVHVTANLYNGGGTHAEAVSVEAYIDSTLLFNGTVRVPARQFLVVNPADARQGIASKGWTATAGRHQARIRIVFSGKVDELSLPFEVRSAVTRVNPAAVSRIPGAMVGSSLSVHPLDIHVQRVPGKPEEVTLTVSVTNRGSAIANSVQVEAFADPPSGRSLGVSPSRLNIGPGRSALFTGFSPWSPTQGARTVSIRVSSPGMTSLVASRSLPADPKLIGARVLPNRIGLASLVYSGPGILVTPTVPKEGEDVQIQIRLDVRNPGASEVRDFQLVVTAERGREIVRLGTISMRAIAAGQTQLINQSYRVKIAGPTTIRVSTTPPTLARPYSRLIVPTGRPRN